MAFSLTNPKNIAAKTSIQSSPQIVYEAEGMQLWQTIFERASSKKQGPRRDLANFTYKKRMQRNQKFLAI